MLQGYFAKHRVVTSRRSSIIIHFFSCALTLNEHFSVSSCFYVCMQPMSGSMQTQDLETYDGGPATSIQLGGNCAAADQ